MKNIKISFLLGLSLFFCTNLYCQTGNRAIDGFINRERERERREREEYERKQRRIDTPPSTSPKYTYNGVEYPTEAARDAAKKAAEEKAKKDNFIKNEKPKIDAGFKSINSSGNTSGYKSMTNSTSSGFREIGESMNKYAENQTKQSAVAVSDKVMRGQKNTRLQASPPVEAKNTKKRKT